MNRLPPVPAALTDPGLADGYGPRAIPDSLDEQLLAFAGAIRGVDAFSQAAEALANSDAGPAQTLAVFGERMASLAVRNKDVKVIRTGLTATALARVLTDDSRDVVTPMVLLYRAAELVGADPDAEFAAAGADSGEAASQALTAFTARSAADKSPAAMYFAERHDADGFRFVFEDPYAL